MGKSTVSRGPGARMVSGTPQANATRGSLMALGPLRERRRSRRHKYRLCNLYHNHCGNCSPCYHTRRRDKTPGMAMVFRPHSRPWAPRGHRRLRGPPPCLSPRLCALRSSVSKTCPGYLVWDSRERQSLWRGLRKSFKPRPPHHLLLPRVCDGRTVLVPGNPLYPPRRPLFRRRAS